MCCKIFWKRVVPFVLAVWLGLSLVGIFQKEKLAENNQEKSLNKIVNSRQGSGSSSNDKGLPPFYTQNPPEESGSRKKTVKIISKPMAKYTDSARQNQVQGKVRLRVDFLASGQIGNVFPITSLPNGLTEQAIASAKQIKFEPQIRNGKPISTIKIVEYNFTIY